MKPKEREYKEIPDQLITQQDTIRNHSKRKQDSVNLLSLLFSQGIPSVYSSKTKAELLLMFNVLLYQALNGRYQNVKCENMKDYEKEALRAFISVHDKAMSIKAGATILKPVPVVKYAGSRKHSVYAPLMLFNSFLTPEIVKDIKSHEELVTGKYDGSVIDLILEQPKATLCPLCGVDSNTYKNENGDNCSMVNLNSVNPDRLKAYRIRHELNQVEPEHRAQMLKDLLAEQEREAKKAECSTCKLDKESCQWCKFK